MQRRTLGGIIAAVAILVIIFLCIFFASGNRSTSVSTSGPVTVDEHNEKNILKVSGGNTILIVLVIFFGLTTAIGFCSFILYYCNYVHLPRRRAARVATLAKQENQMQMAAMMQLMQQQQQQQQQQLMAGHPALQQQQQLQQLQMMQQQLMAGHPALQPEIPVASPQTFFSTASVH